MEGKKEQENREVGQWSEGRKEMAFSERKQEGERKRDKEMEKEGRRGLLYKDASNRRGVAERRVWLKILVDLVSGSHQSQTANTRAHGETAKVVSAKRWAGSGIISYHSNGITK